MVSANLAQCCNRPVQVPLARSPICLRPMTAPLALWSTRPRPTVVGQDGSSKQASELGTLRPTLVLAFSFFSLVPNQLPDWAGTHDDVPIFGWLCSLATD